MESKYVHSHLAHICRSQNENILAFSRFLSWDVRTHSFLFPFCLPFLLSLMMLTYTFRGMPYVYSRLPLFIVPHAYIVWHGTHLFPSLNIPFRW